MLRIHRPMFVLYSIGVRSKTQTMTTKYKDTILFDKRYRREYSSKSWAASRGQKANRARIITEGLTDAISDRIERKEQRRRKRRH